MKWCFFCDVWWTTSSLFPTGLVSCREESVLPFSYSDLESWLSHVLPYFTDFLMWITLNPLPVTISKLTHLAVFAFLIPISQILLHSSQHLFLAFFSSPLHSIFRSLSRSALQCGCGYLVFWAVCCWLWSSYFSLALGSAIRCSVRSVWDHQDLWSPTAKREMPDWKKVNERQNNLGHKKERLEILLKILQ